MLLKTPYSLLIKPVARAINAYFKRVPEAFEPWTALSFHSFTLHLVGFQNPIQIHINATTIELSISEHGSADASITIQPGALFRTSFQDPLELIKNGDLSITGNQHLAEEFLSLLLRTNIDWEEWLSKYLGDPVAHLICQKVLATRRQINRNRNHLIQTITEYLTEEVQWTPGFLQVNSFIKEADRLRDDTDRLEARINQLENKQLTLRDHS